MADAPSADRSHPQSPSLPSLPERGPVAVSLPTSLTSFVGRTREVESLAALLRQDGVRLVTLTGPGGVGKTRLVLRVAEVVAGSFADGVVFVPLAPVTDPDLVLPTLAGALGARPAGDQPLTEFLAVTLQDRHLLLVLDNFEQVVKAAPFVTKLLATCPSLKALVTSRVRLQVSGEQVFPVPPFALPAPGEGTVSCLEAVEAVRLFVARARAARPDFALTEENGAMVGEICRRLDGLPLAIELAAARVAHLPPAALLARLERRLPLLTGGARDAPERQRTIRNTIAWSYDLLSAEEQIIFRRLAVFVGGFTLESAETVADGGEDFGQDVFTSICTLVDKSLLQHVDGPGGAAGDLPRYRMLETIREYGLEQLAASGEDKITRERHAAWFLALAEQAGPVLRQRHDPDVASRLEAEYPNLRVALGWFAATGQGDCLMRLAAALAFFWYLAGYHQEGRAWIEQALVIATETPTAVRARVLCWAGLLAIAVGDGMAAVGRLERAAVLARDLRLQEEESLALTLHGIVLEDRGEYDAAEALFTRALALYPRPHDHLDALKAIYHVGVVAYGRGEADRARALWEEVLTGARALDDDVFAAWCLQYLALQAAEQGELGRAAATLEECLPLSHAAAYRNARGFLLATLTVLGSACGVPQAAARLLGAAEVAEGIPFVPPEGEAFARAGERLRATLGTEAYEQAVAVGREQGDEAVDADARAVLEAAAAAPAPAPVSPDPACGTGLTARELDVLTLLVEGRSNREIAETLFVSPRTVDNHITNILAKLEAKSRTAAVAAARRLGLA